jgi:protein-S-isoprenylcysteine O-methyltransferase Ste14
VQAVLFVLIGFGTRILPPGTIPGGGPWPDPVGLAARVLGVGLIAVGAVLASWGLYALGSRNLTALPYPRDEAELVTSGPYAIVRNPIYSGLLLGSFGWGLWLNSWVTLAFAAALFVLFDLKTRKEEAWLQERFPEYREYCAHVKRLIPWVW